MRRMDALLRAAGGGALLKVRMDGCRGWLTCTRAPLLKLKFVSLGGWDSACHDEDGMIGGRSLCDDVWFRDNLTFKSC